MTGLLLHASTININFGETMLIFVIGMVLIMAVLAMLIGVIYLMRWIIRLFLKKSQKKAKSADVAAASPAPKEQPALAKGSCGELCLNNVSERDAAMVMAIVADQLKTPLNQLRFKSIKQVGEDK